MEMEAEHQAEGTGKSSSSAAGQQQAALPPAQPALAAEPEPTTAPAPSAPPAQGETLPAAAPEAATAATTAESEPAAPVAQEEQQPVQIKAEEQAPSTEDKRSPPPPAPTLDRFVDSASLAYSSSRSASAWNTLLRQARGLRGPQFDFHTGVYHVDTSTNEYFAGVEQAASEADGLAPSFPAVGGGVTVVNGSSTPGDTYESGRPRRRAAR